MVFLLFFVTNQRANLIEKKKKGNKVFASFTMFNVLALNAAMT